MFEGKSVVEVLGQHLYTAAPELSSRTRANVPQSLERLLMACLEKDPARRPPSASSFLESLTAVPALTGWNTTTALDWWQTHRQSAASARPPAETGFTIEVRDPAQRLTSPLVGD